MHIYIYMFSAARLCPPAGLKYIYIYIYVGVCVYMCVCSCVWNLLFLLSANRCYFDDDSTQNRRNLFFLPLSLATLLLSPPLVRAYVGDCRGVLGCVVEVCAYVCVEGGKGEARRTALFYLRQCLLVNVWCRVHPYSTC